MALAAASSPLWWSQAVTNEVYGFHLLFVSLVFFLILQLLKGNAVRRNFLLLAYVLGLAFTNHLQTVLLVPMLALFWFLFRRSWKLGLWDWLSAGGLFLLGLSIYFYLPIRSSAGPLADWGAPSDLGNFIRHVSGWQYRIYMFSLPLEKVLANAKTALFIIFAQIKWPFWLLLPGLLFLSRPISGKAALGFLLYPLTILIYNANYDITDIDRYYLPVVFFLFLLLGLGAFGWLEKIFVLGKGRRPAEVVLGVFLLFSATYSVAANWQRSDQTENRFAQEALENIYGSAPGGGLVLSGVWDHYAAWLYNHYVLGKRTDLAMIDFNLTNRSWHLDFLKRALPDALKGMEDKIPPLRSQILDFEEGRPIDRARIELAYQRMLASLVRVNLARQPVYFDVATNFDSAAGLVLVPEGALFRVYEKPGYYPFQSPPLGFSHEANPNWPDADLAEREVQALGWILSLRENYERQYGPKSSGANTTNRP